MRSAKIIVGILSVLGARATAQQISSPTPAQSNSITIAASTLLDGKGHVLHNARIVVEGSKIVAVNEAERQGSRARRLRPSRPHRPARLD